MIRPRRRLLTGAVAASGLAAAGGVALWPDEGLLNPCLAPDTERWLADPMVREALDGLDATQLWDVHAHLMPVSGRGDAGEADRDPAAGPGGGPWPAPAMWLQQRLQANAACVDGDASTDADAHGAASGASAVSPASAASPPARHAAADPYLAALLARVQAMPAGCKLVLLALDAHHDARGTIQPARTHFAVSNARCAQAVRVAPDRLEWAASVHPYRGDAREAVAQVAAQGARAIKWIPAAQGIDPASPRCEPMYRALAEHRLPLLTHAGDERATAGDDALGNPLRLRRALEAGVRVIVAHCATMGEGVDLDRGEHGPVQPNFALFSRLMDEARHDGRLFGDLSAIPQRARSGPVLATLLQRGAPGGPWAARLLYGSDYPIPGGMPLYSVAELARQGVLDAQRVAPLRALRRHNAWLFDLVLKRLLRAQGQGFAPEVFATRRVLGGR